MTAEHFVLMVAPVADGSAARSQMFTYTGFAPDARTFGVPVTDGQQPEASHLIAHSAADAAFRALLEGMPSQVPNVQYATRDGQTREVIASTIPEVSVGTSPTPQEMLTAMGLAPIARDVAAPWIQPVPGVTSPYQSGSRVTHAGTTWESEVDDNVWEPGAQGSDNLWTDLNPTQTDEWVQPSGAHDAYALGDLVTHEGRIWRSEVQDNVWEPGVVGENIWSDQGPA